MKNLSKTYEYKSQRRIPMPPPTRAVPMSKKEKLNKIAKREMKEW